MGFWRELFLTFSVVALTAMALALIAPRLLRLSVAQGQLLVGLICGAGAIGAMASSATVAPGIQIDLRTSLVATAALVGGPLGAVTTAILAMGFRAYQGGAGAGVGAAIVALTAAASLGVRMACMKRRVRRRAIVIAALATGLITAAAVVALPTLTSQQRWDLSVPLFWLTVVTIILVGFTLRQASDWAWESHMLRSALAQAPNFFYVKNRRSQIVAANQQVAEHHGFASPEALRGRTDLELSPGAHAAALFEAEQALMRSGTPIIEKVEKLRRPDGSEAWYETSKVALRDPWGAVIGLTGVTVDITQRMRLEADLRAANAALEALAGTDPLTGLANRRSFDAALARAIAEAQRRDTGFAVLMLDVDMFKSYNDLYGHMQGDDCLKAIAGVLVSALQRPADIAARYGGEEFAMVLPDTDLAGAMVVAERIRADIVRRAITHKGSPFGVVTASIGVATSMGGEAAQQVMAAADAALYAAKLADRNTVRNAGAPAS
ncbi:PAS domain S-box-containing protein/diguanylate cyclase (GGDEF) domain-containing protein [Devosia enhydra]|uniref:diguanylate cyclase n=1 Tax=Devosia enhydra TaxID=665118 RepID=A0A1K2I1G4_9HYPH|nr:diguanylate cyclase [Devosia enhydra]SFZ86169.1 PAS domain S-box-containing protein/diguanylate cyclase (GGDEF) domain-containing protein [Devosia enhydra]